MLTTPFVPLENDELTQLVAYHMAYCRDNPAAEDWKRRYARAAELTQMLDSVPLERQVQVYAEATP